MIRTIQENIYEVSLHGPAMNVYAKVLDEARLDDLFASLDALRRDLAGPGRARQLFRERITRAAREWRWTAMTSRVRAASRSQTG